MSGFILVAASLFLAACNVASVVKSNADHARRLMQLRELASLNLSFAVAHEGHLAKTFDELLSAQKISDRSVLASPSARDKSKPSYELLLPGERLSNINNPARTIFIRPLDPLPNGGRYVAFADGHVEFVGPD